MTDFTGLTLTQRNSLRAPTLPLLPVSPRTIRQETLSSYCMRLGAVFGLTTDELLQRLGISRGVPLESLEVAPCSVLTERLAVVTGRSIERFTELQRDADELALPVAQRTAFCPHCWLERRRADAAHLVWSWSRPWAFFCLRHPQYPLHQLDATTVWNDLACRRSQWRILADSPGPSAAWREACADLRVDARDEWRASGVWLRDVQHAMLPQPTVPVDDLRMLCDLANYVQIAWPHLSHARVAPVGTPTRYVHEHDLCHGRQLAGSLVERLRTVIQARHLLASMRRGGGTPLGRMLWQRLARRRRAHVETWWLRRRLLQWSEPECLRACELFSLSPKDWYELPSTEACHHCVRVAQPPLSEQWLYVRLDRSFICVHDPWRRAAN